MLLRAVARLASSRSAIAAIVVTNAALIAACDPNATDARYWERLPSQRQGGDGGGDTSDGPSGTGGAGSTVTAGSPTSGEGVTSVTSGGPASSSSGAIDGDCASIAFTTVSYDGRYSPKNVGAVWISDANGAFVRTLETWGHQRLKNAVAWRAASAGDDVDAITGATRTSHGPHNVIWDCRDASGQVRTTGGYQVHAEFTEENSSEGKPPGPHRVVPIDIGVPGTASTPDDAGYVGVSVVSRP